MNIKINITMFKSLRKNAGTIIPLLRFQVKYQGPFTCI